MNRHVYLVCKFWGYHVSPRPSRGQGLPREVDPVSLLLQGAVMQQITLGVLRKM
jgi:hypothetical protein